MKILDLKLCCRLDLVIELNRWNKFFISSTQHPYVYLRKSSIVGQWNLMNKTHCNRGSWSKETEWSKISRCSHFCWFSTITGERGRGDSSSWFYFLTFCLCFLFVRFRDPHLRLFRTHSRLMRKAEKICATKYLFFFFSDPTQTFWIV